MKITKFISTSLLLSFIVACVPSTEKAMEYHDKIIKQQTLISENFDKLNDTYNVYIAEEMNAAFESALKQIEESTKKVEKIKAFDEDKVFRKAFLEAFKVYKSVLETEHKRIIELYVLPISKYQDDEIEELKNLRDKALERVDEIQDKLIIVEKEFAKKYKFELTAE